MPAVTVDTALAVQLATRDGRVRQLRVSVPALLAGTALEDAELPMAAMRGGVDASPLLGLQGLSISMTSAGMNCLQTLIKTGRLMSGGAVTRCHRPQLTVPSSARAHQPNVVSRVRESGVADSSIMCSLAVQLAEQKRTLQVVQDNRCPWSSPRSQHGRTDGGWSLRLRSSARCSARWTLPAAS